MEDQLFAAEVIGRAEYNFEPEKTHAMGVRTWRYPLKGGVALANYCWVYPHFADCVLV